MVLELETQLEAEANLMEIDAAKNRNGPVGDVKLWVDVAASAIRDERPDERPDIQQGFKL